jgi:hypothetical protein
VLRFFNCFPRCLGQRLFKIRDIRIFRRNFSDDSGVEAELVRLEGKTYLIETAAN